MPPKFAWAPLYLVPEPVRSESNDSESEFPAIKMNLFEPFRLRGAELKNRIVVSPMCEYSAKDGHPTSWHMVHLGSRAVGVPR